ncbi:AIDA-I autotransporter precursor [Budvicia aquatica]|uniref:AIDA-I autotransporter n=1 Tax=Budvicia aquatica TaxID=82979 RepID=A0A484ZC60_9GAMM|nr:AIDA-I autotransporter precursor [Budvicia aquatica]
MLASGIPANGIDVHGSGSKFINDGVLNINPAYWSGVANGTNYGLTLTDGAEGVNNRVINAGITEGNKGRNAVGNVQAVRVNGANSTFTNASGGHINIGFAENGDLTYVKPGSYGIYAYGASQVDNQGTITLGSKVEGSSAIYTANITNGGQVVNSGSIIIAGDGDKGNFTPQTNTGILAVDNSRGVYNTGTIDITGVNAIGIKTLSGGQVISSGTINITGGADPSTGLRNYGAWSEGVNSLVDIANTVNLKGQGAIGVHARDKGTINLSGTGQVTFADGENQIGYFIYGSGSAINNTSSGSQDVTTKNSTLMRLDGGASFTGSSAATSTMSASGEKSTVITATGLGTTVNSGGMTVNVKGKDATGFLIEGGANGTISDTANIHLLAEGTTAGIADGQGHDLTGADSDMTDVERKLTSLTTKANLNSSLASVVGYIARNMAILTNTGNITFSGESSTGIQVGEGATGVNSGNITLGGVGSVGLQASANNTETRLSSTGNITLNGDWVNTNDSTRSTGVRASGSKVLVTMGDGTTPSAINLNGSGSIGVHASAGSQITFTDNTSINFNSAKSDQIAFWAEGTGSKIISQASTSNQVNGDGITLFYVTDGATMEGGLTMELSGLTNSSKETSAIRVNGTGSLATLTAGSLLTIGENAIGILAENAGGVDVKQGSAFVIKDNQSIVGQVTGDSSTINNGASVSSLAGSDSSTAFVAENGGLLTNSGNIDLSLGANHTAIDLNNGHVINQGNILANGTAIYIRGADSSLANSGTITAVDGLAAIRVGAGAGLDLSAVSTVGTIVAKGTADGILLDAGATHLNVADTIIDMSDPSARGIGIHNVAGVSGIRLDNTDIKMGGSGIGIKTGAALSKENSGTIAVTNGTGILYQNENGSDVAANLDLSESEELTIKVTGSGSGITALLDGNDREVNTNVRVDVTSATGGSAINVSGAKTVTNSGILTSASTAATGNVLNVDDAEVITNSGTIQASSANMAAIGMSNTGDKTFTNSGDITGFLDFSSGDNLITLTGGKVDGNILANGGANTLTLSGGAKQIGTVTLAGNQANTVDVSGENTALGNLVMSGTGNHQVDVTDNATTGDITVGTGNNSLTLKDLAHIGHFIAGNNGENSVLVKNSATFDSLDAGTGGSNDRLTFDNTNYTLSNTNDIQHFDLLNLTNDSAFTTDRLIQMGDSALTSGRIAIDSTSSLVFTPAGAYTLNHGLSGNGLIDVQSGTAFDFGSDAGSQFTGLVKMNSDRFTLQNLNTTALTNATLSVMANNITTVGQGSQAIGGLVLSGGTVNFGTSIPNSVVSNNFIQANTLDASGTGKVQIDSDGFDNGVAPIVDQTQGLLDQQTKTLVQLVSAATVTGDAGALKLVGLDGNEITDATELAISQNGTHAANAHYDYRLTTKDDNAIANGLYASYGLTQLDLLTNGSTKLVINTDHSLNKVLSAKVTGTGDLGILAGHGSDALTLSNQDNSYSGETDLKEGTLILGNDNAFGQTSKLNLAINTIADMNSHSQTIGELNGAATSTLNLNNGALTLTNGGTSSGSLTGSGNLALTGGTLTVANANNTLSATTTVGISASALLQDVKALGTGSVVANGQVTLDNASGTFANAVSGSGQLNSYRGSDVRLSGNNANFTGMMDIDSTSTLTVSENKHIGQTTGIKNAGEFIVDNSAAMTLAAIVSGTGDLIKKNTGTLTLSGSSSYSGQTQIQNGIVAISADENLGNGSATNKTVLNGGNLQITANLESERDVTLQQAGSIMVNAGVTASMNGWDDSGQLANAFTKAGDGTLIWTGEISDNSSNIANVNVTGGTLQVDSLLNLASAAGEVSLGANGTLSILKTSALAGDVDFTRTLTGSGELKVNLGNRNQEFTFNSSAAGGDFTGRVTMDDGRFILNNDADNAMGLATLQLNGSAGKLGSSKLEGTHTLGGLTMNGGQLEVDYSTIDHRPKGFLTVDKLDTTGGGNLAITTPSNLPNPMPVTGESLFDQDDNIYDQIVAAATVNGDGTQLAVTQVDGTPVAPDTIVALTQGGATAGNAHYNYFGAVKSDGLYLGYGLTQLDAFSGQSIMLTNSNATDNKLGAKLTGDGGFTVNAIGTVHIGNATSNYTGATDLNSGNVVLITDNGFGHTSALNMLNNTQVDLNGNSQTVGQLNMAANSLFNLHNGELTVTNGGQVDGNLAGAGQLNLTGSSLNLTQNNGQFTGTTVIETNATARLTMPQGLGQGAIHNDGTLNLDTARGTLLNSLTGQGDVMLTNAADMYLGGNNSGFNGSFTTKTGTTLTATAENQLGSANVNNAGKLVLDTANLWSLTNAISGSGTLVKRGTGTLQLDGDNVSVGLTDIENGLVLIGGLPESARSRAASTPANLTGNVVIRQNGALGGYGKVTGSVDNSGNLIMGHALTGAGHGIFTIDGNYNGGDKSKVIFNTYLEDDRSSTDKLVITGNTTGNSNVVVMSLRGDGAQTSEGIKLIDVQGSSDGKFTLSGRAIAGAYEYFLYQGAISTPDDGDWYLRSSLNGLNPNPSVFSPDAGGYMANMAAAGKLFNLRLEDREGRAENSSMWLRQEGSRTKHRDSSGQLRTATNSYVIQGGGEVFDTHFTDTDRFGLGLMAAYGKADSKVGSLRSKANSSIDGYSAGVYGTWYQDAKTLNGAYVDSWVQYSWLDAEVNGQGKATESYNMDGFSASVEAGYRLPVYQGLNGDVFITPQGQITWSGITADDHQVDRTKISSSGHDNVTTRLGVKVSRDGVSDQDKGTNKLFTVYAEANWLHNSQQAGAVLDGTEVKLAGNRNVGELKLGTEGQVNTNLNLWTNVAQQLGDNGYSDTTVTLGVKYRF